MKGNGRTPERDDDRTYAGCKGRDRVFDHLATGIFGHGNGARRAVRQRLRSFKYPRDCAVHCHGPSRVTAVRHANTRRRRCERQ